MCSGRVQRSVASVSLHVSTLTTCAATHGKHLDYGVHPLQTRIVRSERSRSTNAGKLTDGAQSISLYLLPLMSSRQGTCPGPRLSNTTGADTVILSRSYDLLRKALTPIPHCTNTLQALGRRHSTEFDVILWRITCRHTALLFLFTEGVRHETYMQMDRAPHCPSSKRLRRQQRGQSGRGRMEQRRRCSKKKFGHRPLIGTPMGEYTNSLPLFII